MAIPSKSQQQETPKTTYLSHIHNKAYLERGHPNSDSAHTNMKAEVWESSLSEFTHENSLHDVNWSSESTIKPQTEELELSLTKRPHYRKDYYRKDFDSRKTSKFKTRQLLNDYETYVPTEFCRRFSPRQTCQCCCVDHSVESHMYIVS